MKILEDVEIKLSEVPQIVAEAVCRYIIVQDEISDTVTDSADMTGAYAISPYAYKEYMSSVFSDMTGDVNLKFDIIRRDDWDRRLPSLDINENAIKHIEMSMVEITYRCAREVFEDYTIDGKNFDHYVFLNSSYASYIDENSLVKWASEALEKYEGKKLVYNTRGDGFKEIVVSEITEETKAKKRDASCETITKYGFTLARDIYYDENGRIAEIQFKLINKDYNSYEDIVYYHSAITNVLTEDENLEYVMDVIADDFIDKENEKINDLYMHIVDKGMDIEDVSLLTDLKWELESEINWVKLKTGYMILNVSNDDSDFFYAHKDVLNKMQNKVKIIDRTEDDLIILREVVK